MGANRATIRSRQTPPAIGRALALALLLLAALGGCSSHRQHTHLHPIDPSFALPTEKTLEYPGKERFWNTAGLVISPARIVAEVGSEVPMFAGVCDAKGQLQPHERVEWMLDNGGVGSFVTVAEPIRPFCLELVSTKARKIDNTYAETETLPANVILTRGTPDINDDTVMPRGYTWVTVTSPVEGTSYVTAFGPDVYSWDARQRSAKIHWIDAEWVFPEAACVSPGTPVTLTTCVARKTTKAPVSDWIVRYTITGGAAAGFGADNAQSVEIATGEDGRAVVELIPGAVENGTVCINVELIRPECALAGASERLSIATAATQVTWGTQELPAPPPSQPMVPTVPNPPPATAPPAITPGPAPNVPPSSPPPPQTPSVPKITVRINGPETGDIQSDVAFKIQVINEGTTPATDLVLMARFDEGLKHASATSPMEKMLGRLEPGQFQDLLLNFRLAQPGRRCFTLEVTDLRLRSQGIIVARGEGCINVKAPPAPPPQAALNVEVTGPPNAIVGELVRFRIVVKNTGDIPAQAVRINAELDQPLNAQKATPDVPVARTPTGVLFTVDQIPPGREIVREIDASCVAPQRACCRAIVADASGEMQSHEHCLEIRPAPVADAGPIRIEVLQNRNPVGVNANVNYQVVVRNGTANSERQVRLAITLPPEMSLVGEPIANVRVQSREGNVIRFAPIAELRGNESMTFNFTVRTTRAGQAQLRAEVTSFNIPTPIEVTQTTSVVE